MLKQKVKLNKLFNAKWLVLLVVFAVATSTTVFNDFRANAASCSSATDCQQQISNLNSQNSQAQQSLSSLAAQAGSYQATINSLESQISTLQAQINANQAQQASLQTQIDQDQAQITYQKQVLSADIRAMYVEGQTSTLEVLASSSDLSQFVTKEVDRSAVQDKVKTELNTIAQLETQLTAQQAQVTALLQTQQTQQSQLSSTESQQAQLLGYNKSQQAQYNQQISANSSNISQLRARLSALNDAGSSTQITGSLCGGGYPTKTASGTSPGTYWGCNEPQDNTTDNWKMLNRECVSYTAYMASTKYGVSTSGWGSAYQWIAAAEKRGYTVDQTPAVGAIAIRDIDYSEPGDVGHAMYVVAVNGPDSITVDEYNEHYNGQFDERQFTPSSYASRGGLYYIHF